MCTNASFRQLQKYSIDQPDCIVPNVWMQSALLLPDIFRVHQSITWPVVDHSMIARILHLQLAHTILLSVFHTRLVNDTAMLPHHIHFPIQSQYDKAASQIKPQKGLLSCMSV